MQIECKLNVTACYAFEFLDSLNISIFGSIDKISFGNVLQKK